MTSINSPLIFLFSILISLSTFAQELSLQRQVDWSSAGLEFYVEPSNNSVNLLDFGADSTGNVAADSALNAAIDALGGAFGEVFIPEGTYSLTQTLHLPDSVVLRGESAEQSMLRLDLGGNPIHGIVMGGTNPSNYQGVIGGFEKGSTKIITDSVQYFAVGDLLDMQQDNGIWDTNPASWAEAAVGQIIRIEAISGDTLFIDQELRLDFDTALNLRIAPFEARRHAGIQCLSIERTEDIANGAAAYNIYVHHAENCRITGVNSHFSVGAHILIDASSHILVSGCNIQDAYTFDGSGTRGYGVTLTDRAGLCLIENNIFKRLRHAMMVKVGANGNVFAGNYSEEANRSEPINDYSGDISLHGHFAFANLFEHNTVENIIIDHFWGPSGPYNTFLRNRINLYGLIMTQGSVQTDDQNFIANEITNTGFVYGNYTLTGSNHFESANDVTGDWRPSTPTGNFPESYYYTERPYYWQQSAWPAIGYPAPDDLHKIPAQQQFELQAEAVDCSFAVEPDTQVVNGINVPDQHIIKAFPNPFGRHFYIELDEPIDRTQLKLELYDLSGRNVPFTSIRLSNTMLLVEPESTSGQMLKYGRTGVFILEVQHRGELHYNNLLHTE